MQALLDLLHLRPGESRRVLWFAVVGAAYAGATSLGDDIAQAVFVARAGAEALPRMFLLKGILDVVAALIYLPLARGRSAGSVWRLAMVLYLGTVVIGWLWAAQGTVAGAYGLYVLHESAWTILTIHWTVLILEVFDANQARRLFPLLFAATRLGGIGAGGALGYMAKRTSALDLLGLCLALAAVAGALTWFSKSKSPAQPPGSQSLLRTGRSVFGSPLIRAIALSTAAMVLVRYGLRMVSMHEINVSYHYDEDLVAEFLGQFRVWANTVSAILGILVVPKLLTWIGVGAMNLLYAFATFAAFAFLVVSPNLSSAALARFVEQQFKDAAKTPLSALFYGAEPAHLRGAARAFMFGAVIPAATAITAIVFELLSEQGELQGVALTGGALAIVFVVLSELLTRQWRRRIQDRLATEMSTSPDLDPRREQLVRKLMSQELQSEREGVRQAALALACADSTISALGEEVLAESISRRRAHKVARLVRGSA